MTNDKSLIDIEKLQLKVQEQLRIAQEQTAYIAVLKQQVEAKLKQADAVLNQEENDRHDSTDSYKR